MIHYQLLVTGERPTYRTTGTQHYQRREPTGETETYQIAKVSGSAVSERDACSILLAAAQSILPPIPTLEMRPVGPA